MKTSPAGKEFIKQFESLRLKAYRDSVGIWTVGYGSTKGVIRDMEINLDEAESRFDSDLAPGEQVLNALNVLTLQYEFDALSSLIFNIGPKAFKKSTLYKFLFAKDFSSAADEFLRWDKGRDPKTGEIIKIPGLTRRRKAEKDLFVRGIY